MKSETDRKVEKYEDTKLLEVLIAYSDENGHKGYCIAPAHEPDFWLNHLPTLTQDMSKPRIEPMRANRTANRTQTLKSEAESIRGDFSGLIIF